MTITSAKKRPGYNEAIEEIETIIGQLESENVDVDILSDKVKRVSYLIKICRERLLETEVEIEKVLKEIQQ